MPQQENKPVQYDATGRMIRTWDKPAQITPAMQAELDAAKSELKRFEDNKYEISARFLKNYLDNTGKAQTITSKEMRASPTFAEAMKENRQRFIDSITKGEVNGKPHKFKDEILGLKDGQKIMLDADKNLQVEIIGTVISRVVVWCCDLFLVPILIPINSIAQGR